MNSSMSSGWCRTWSYSSNPSEPCLPHYKTWIMIAVLWSCRSECSVRSCLQSNKPNTEDTWQWPFFFFLITGFFRSLRLKHSHSSKLGVDKKGLLTQKVEVRNFTARHFIVPKHFQNRNSTCHFEDCIASD